MVFYVRHGESTGDGSNPGLSENGQAMAREAAGWLAARGYRPARILTTPRRRTRETATRLADHAWEGGRPEVVERTGSARSGTEWEALAEELGEGGLFVGHHPTQHLLVRIAGAPEVPQGNRCAVFVLEKGARGWRCAGSWEGRPKRGG
jgi:phosphohistidine phosphatase SixA